MKSALLFAALAVCVAAAAAAHPDLANDLTKLKHDLAQLESFAHAGAATGVGSGPTQTKAVRSSNVVYQLNLVLATGSATKADVGSKKLVNGQTVASRTIPSKFTDVADNLPAIVKYILPVEDSLMHGGGAGQTLWNVAKAEETKLKTGNNLQDYCQWLEDNGNGLKTDMHIISKAVFGAIGQAVMESGLDVSAGNSNSEKYRIAVRAFTGDNGIDLLATKCVVKVKKTLAQGEIDRHGDIMGVLVYAFKGLVKYYRTNQPCQADCKDTLKLNLKYICKYAKDPLADAIDKVVKADAAGAQNCGFPGKVTSSCGNQNDEEAFLAAVCNNQAANINRLAVLINA